MSDDYQDTFVSHQSRNLNHLIMKNQLKTLSIIAATLLVIVACSDNKSEQNERESAAAAAVASEASVAESDIVWTAYKITGDSHTGTLQLKSSSLELDGNQIVGGNFEVDMNTLENTDLEGEWHQKLISHLKSDDFFGVETFPVSRFSITNVTPLENNQFEITGDMTIKEKTNPIKLIASTEVVGNELVIKANFDVDRSKFDVRYGSSSFFENLGDKAIQDNFNLDIQIKSPLGGGETASLD